MGYTKKYKKRSYAKKSKAPRSTQSLYKRTTDIKRSAPFPGIAYRTLPYSYLQTGISGSATASAQVFRLNSLYDPDMTGAGAQPYGHDSLAALYYRYCVQGVTISAQVVNNSTTSCLLYCALPSDPTNSITTQADLGSELPGAIFALIPPDSSKNIKMKIDFKKLLSKDIVDDDNWAAAFGDNPGNPYFLYTYVQAADKVNTGSYAIKYTIDYNTKVSEAKPLLPS
ncbi:hypothetical protein [Nocardia mangyaensis]|uniref:hypothetical protein n=1 Tax=Nocardia mangyaensis TaxID=2213200 RepID=UPI002674D76D|nr:hypothetical protein [Nocardia mangyaensis]MDO3651306.1 hypothetical protein [Nocardia mangyaensis]